jgi:predicted tellurium resistance membrane protein TerC
MKGLFTIDNFVTLAMLTLLQAVLGLHNLLYISLESKRAPEKEQKRVRNLGIGMAIRKSNSILEKESYVCGFGAFYSFYRGYYIAFRRQSFGSFEIFGNEVTAMRKTTFYFVIVVLVLIDIIQLKYQKKLLMNK